jgi:hypothetical protein
MTESYDLLPELEDLLGNVFKPELEQIVLYFYNKKVCVKLIFNQESGMEAEETDLSFIVSGSEPMFSVANSLEHNRLLLLATDNITKLIAFDGAFTHDGIDEIIGNN